MTTGKIKVVLKTTASSELFRASIDEKRVRFVNGEAVLQIEPRENDYVLTWFIRDTPGTKYAILITEPEKIKMNYETALDASGKDAGIYWFKI